MKKGLGKGINDIFGIEEDDNDLDLSTDPQSSVQDIEITRIYSSKGQPRKHFDKENKTNKSKLSYGS